MGGTDSVSDRRKERAVLVGVVLGDEPEHETRESLDELGRLAGSAGAEETGRFVCRQNKVRPGYYIGTGKAAEIGAWAEEHPADTLVFDENLSPVQGRNLEKATGLRVIDRTQLIMDIFAQHARTREGQLQVELAQLEYLLPRLRRMWTHLERQKGGIGLRGPGETQIEMDRRRIQMQIKRLKRDLELVRRRRAEQRKGRKRGGWSLVSIVGYTNAGKSTLLNRLAGASVHADSALFATLDPTIRRVELPGHEPVLLSDTVGFISKLPHSLVEAFKATLEEVVEADLLLHVVDASHPRAADQARAVNEVLEELGVGDKPVFCALNKIDRAEGRHRSRRLLRDLAPAAALSARSGEGVETLKEALADRLRSSKTLVEMRIPIGEGRLIAELHRRGTVLEEAYDHDAARIKARIPPDMRDDCARFVTFS
ncbi:GTPase HflX [Kiritimatiella glycovorans]|uniref:GTPase HflX n=1 Tax=Kiritimatiella glycovorans TaxID=1307763 RepID=A0A0G3EH43_9BACT|nr:GTPase HflX [Kiritimatiella glycovorans]AKJ64130.1 GTP-binding protein HflX [Kiritimatiella glycovorans]